VNLRRHNRIDAVNEILAVVIFLVLSGNMIVSIMFPEKLKFSCILAYLSFSASFCGFSVLVFCIQILLLNTFSQKLF